MQVNYELSQINDEYARIHELLNLVREKIMFYSRFVLICRLFVFIRLFTQDIISRYQKDKPDQNREPHRVHNRFKTRVNLAPRDNFNKHKK